MTGQGAGRRCSVCSSPQAAEVAELLGSGSSLRQVSRLTGFPRTTLARHAPHVAPLPRRFGVIRTDDGPDGPPDPLEEALALAARARTPRERLRGLEQVRAAAKLKLRRAERADDDHLALLDRNIAEAEQAYRDAPDFETQARALGGWREAILQRIDAERAPDAITVELTIANADGTPIGDPRPLAQDPETYWTGVPSRFRDPLRYVVQREIGLSFTSTDPTERIRVREIASGALAWATERGGSG